MARAIVITEPDMKLLRSLIQARKAKRDLDFANLVTLEQELDEARVIGTAEISPEVVTMDSRVRVRDLESGTESEYSVVFPASADASSRKVSVLAPIGTALLGYGKGDTVEVEAPGGIRRLRIEDILYQPESAETPDRPSP